MESKIKSEDYSRFNNIYWDENKLRLQVPQILCGECYSIDVSDENMYDLRNSNRVLFDRIKGSSDILSQRIGNIALLAAMDIEAAVIKFIEDTKKEVEDANSIKK